MPADPTSPAVDRSPPGEGTAGFSVPGFYGEVTERYRPQDLEREVRRLVDPASARQTLHWGRNYLYAADLQAPGGAVGVVVKQFRNQGLGARLKRRRLGSKATRSWRAARELVAAGVPTPEPVMLIESTLIEGPSFYVSRKVEGFFEARYLFRALAQDRRRELFPEVDEEAFFRAAGAVLRRLHAAGVWHRDVSIGNLLVSYEDGAAAPPTVYLVDLNRARLGVRMTVRRRLKDLCRLPVLDRRHREAFLGAYLGPAPRHPRLWSLAFGLWARGFLVKNRFKDAARRPFRAIRGIFAPRRAHVHIPPAPAGAASRDKVVWDYLSDQPHQHAGRFERTLVRLKDSPIHLRTAMAAVGSVPRVWSRYRELRAGLYSGPRPWGTAGVAVRPLPGNPAGLLAALDDLGVKSVLLRLHPWEGALDDGEALARELARRGYDLSFALPQNRDLVRDLGRWRAAVEEIGERFLPYGRRFQIGQAINRSKWGVWNYREYLDLTAAAIESLRARGDVEVMGPAVIDFELHATAAVLNMPHPVTRFDVVTSLLYVDRRGAPENRQLGFDTVGKVALLRAIAETARHPVERCWITEVNWPLIEGPHSPAGKHVAVDEETQADYLARYYLLTLGTGLVERVYWWQLVARGYGLVDRADDGGLRRRPSYEALRFLERRLAGATFLGPLAAPSQARLYLFRTADGGETAVGWSTAEPAPARLPRPAAEAAARGGDPLPAPSGEEVELTPSPRYFRLV